MGRFEDNLKARLQNPELAGVYEEAVAEARAALHDSPVAQSTVILGSVDSTVGATTFALIDPTTLAGTVSSGPPSPMIGAAQPPTQSIVELVAS
jgi:hypothetical protein